jgi:phosphoribosyl-ATP pyrophosphohydrolase
MDEETKKKALSFGKKLFELGKDAAKKVADEAGKVYNDFEEKRKEELAMEAKEGSFYSQFSVDDLWLQMARDLTPNIGHLGVSLKADPDILRITTLVQYTEQIPGVRDVIRQLTCYVDFQPQENGTLILYRWHVYEIPPNGYLNTNIIRNMNKRIKTCAQLGPQTPGGM